MNKSNSFFSNLLENFGFLMAFATAFSQYFVGSNFKQIFGENQYLYSSVSTVALILSVAIILGVYCNRFKISLKTYLNKSKTTKYFEYLSKKREESLENKEKKNEDQIKEVKEPFGYTIIQLSFLFIFLSLVFFALTIYFGHIYIGLVSYILFICSTVSSISIFSIQLYKDNEFTNKKRESDEIVFEKIKDYFADKIKIEYDSTDYSTINGPDRQIIFEYSGKRYRVFTKSNNPENYFLISEFEKPKS